MISVPRNLTLLPFPPGTPLAEQFPRGFTDLANAVYPYVHSRPALAGGGADAGAQAIKLGIAQLLGVPIQYYVLADMGGFINVVDALGGIDVTVRPADLSAVLARAEARGLAQTGDRSLLNIGGIRVRVRAA
jgi:anionic cell wall polymer biosynthesis LytR-Cps2A-Psr (LCP) family protein